jgi:hypothetical protein
VSIYLRDLQAEPVQSVNFVLLEEHADCDANSRNCRKYGSLKQVPSTSQQIQFAVANLSGISEKQEIYSHGGSFVSYYKSFTIWEELKEDLVQDPEMLGKS